MKLKQIILTALITATAITPTFADTQNTVEGVYIIPSNKITTTTLKIGYTDTIKGIQAGDKFSVDTGKDTNILTVNHESGSMWQRQQKINPDRLYVKTGDKSQLLIDDKIDIQEQIAEAFEKNGEKARIKDDEAYLDYKQNPVTLTKTNDHHFIVEAMSKEKIQDLVDEVIEKVAYNSNVTNSFIIDDIKKTAREKNIGTQFAITLYMDIDYTQAYGSQSITIDAMDSSVTSQVLDSARVENKNLKVTAQNNQNKVTITISGYHDTLTDSGETTFVLPAHYTWQDPKAEKDQLEINIDKENQNTITVKPNMRKLHNNTEKLTFTAEIKGDKTAPIGPVTAQIKSDKIKQNKITLIDQYKKDSKITIFKLRDTRYTTYDINANYHQKNMETAPDIKNGRTMLPIRYVSEAIDAKVDYDNQTKIAIFTKGKTKVKIDINKPDQIEIDGKIEKLYPELEVKNERVLLPIRAITEAFAKENIYITWDRVDSSITVTVQ